MDPKQQNAKSSRLSILTFPQNLTLKSKTFPQKMPFSSKTMENFSSGHHKIEEKLPIFPQKPSKRWKKSRWTPSESIYTFLQEIEKFQTASSSDAASRIFWKVAAAPRSVTPRSRCSLRSFDIDDHTRGCSRPLYVSQKY